jgi:oligoendopeptidase F
MLQPALASGTFASRDDVPEQYKWDLSRVYASQADFDNDVKRLENELIPRIAGFRGTLGVRASALACMEAHAEARMLFYKIYLYANASMYTALDDGAAQALSGQAQFLLQYFTEASSFIDPELALLGETVIRSYLNDPDFAEYRKILNSAFYFFFFIFADNFKVIFILQFFIKSCFYSL